LFIVLLPALLFLRLKVAASQHPIVKAANHNPIHLFRAVGDAKRRIDAINIFQRQAVSSELATAQRLPFIQLRLPGV